MKVNIIYGDNTDKAIQECYKIILSIYRDKLKRDRYGEKQSSENTNKSQTATVK